MKKFLSMALALVMTLSLCTFITVEKADAAFTDVAELSSQYAEQAADVIQTIEVMDGYDDGSFRPTAGLTRQAAAKIICNMILGPTTARALPTNANPFPDVLAGNQFSGYISYCAQQGIISGYGDGTFRPGDPLSGYAYLKMLLGALGYDAKTEGFVGDNWKVNVAKIALGIGLNRGIEEDLDGATQVTRESAAIYAFNTLQADMVEYESKNTLEINGVVVSMGGGNAVPQTWGTSVTQAGNINQMTDTGTAGGRPIVQFAERYFDKLVRNPNGAANNNGRDMYVGDDFGRPSVKWSWKGVEIGTYSRDPDATFVGGVDVNKIYEALGMTSSDDNARLYINSSLPNKTDLKVSRGNDKGIDHANNMNKNANGYSTTTRDDLEDGSTHYIDRVGDGCIIECFLNDSNNHVDVCVISVYGGKVDAVKGATAKKDAYVTIDWGDDDFHHPQQINKSGNNEFETEDFVEDDVVAYTFSDSANEIKSMYLLSPETGTLQSKVSGKSMRLGDTTYKYGKEYTFDDFKESNLSTKSSYVVYLDENDFVLWVEEDEFAVDDYVLVERITIETTVDGVTTKTASVLGTAEAGEYNYKNDEAWQIAYNQSKAPVGTSSWDAQAQLRYPNGTRRTVTLDDSKNYRTSAASDNLYYDAATYNDDDGDGQVSDGDSINTIYARDGITDITNQRGAIAGNNDNGNGDGNWIASPFTAGKIVRVSSNSSGYRLHSINSDRYTKVDQFVLRSNQIWEWDGADTVNIKANGQTIRADSETHFVVDDVDQGSYKSYVGVKNAPDVSDKAGVYPTAYIYYNDGTAKLVYITNAQQVSSSSNDIVFLAATSISDMIESDDGKYYEITAVEKNQIKTLMIKADAGVSFDTNDALFTPGGKDQDKAFNCVILNNVSYDSNDFMTRGSFNGGPGRDNAYMAHGIRRVNSEEIRVNTAAGRSSQLKDVAENIRVYFVDGDNITQIEYSEIVNDTQDYVYYVEDNDGEVTYLFIVDYEPDDDTATASITEANRTVLASDAKNYSIRPTRTTVAAGQSFDFTVYNITDDTNANGVITGVDVHYVDEGDNDLWVAAAYDADEGIYTVRIPAAGDTLKDGSEITFDVIP